LLKRQDARTPNPDQSNIRILRIRILASWRPGVSIDPTAQTFMYPPGCSSKERLGMPNLTNERLNGVRALAIAAAVLGVPAAAHAHFVLNAPASWMSQDSSGSPQKTGPCGNEGGGTASGAVTAYHPGDQVTITVNETVFHPGHYRVALGMSGQGDLPAEPTVTAGTSACGSVPVQSPPVFPVIADGVFDHTAAFSGPQTIQVTLPADVTCTKCTLQVLEFMSSHGAPCFYHHCADISILPAGTGNDASTGPTGSSGGGCSLPGRRPSAIAAIAGLLALATLTRRRR
jgi:hypothetical protein